MAQTGERRTCEAAGGASPGASHASIRTEAACHPIRMIRLKSSNCGKPLIRTTDIDDFGSICQLGLGHKSTRNEPSTTCGSAAKIPILQRGKIRSQNSNFNWD
jgi:hypothetical protein